MADGRGTRFLRAILRLRPSSVSAQDGLEIAEMAGRRRKRIVGSSVRFWSAEIRAAVVFVLAAWADHLWPRRAALVAPSGSWVRALAADVRYAARAIVRSAAVSVLVMATLAVGIGAVLTIFALVDGVLLTPISIPEVERVVRVFEATNPEMPFGRVSYPLLNDLRRSEFIEGPAGWFTIEAGLRTAALSDRVSVGVVTGDFFDVLRVPPAAGRTLQVADDAVGADPVVMLSHALWVRLFGADTGVVGSSIELSGASFVVVGVAPAGFSGPSLTSSPELWVPFSRLREVAGAGLYAAPNIFETRAFGWILLVGRLPEGVQMAAAEAELDGISRAVQIELDADAVLPESPVARLQPLSSSAWIRPSAARATTVAGDRDEMLRFVRLLGAVVAATLLIACLNAALLISTRAWSRDLELGVMQALGAGRGRVLRHLMVENLMLAVCGAGTGLILAQLAGRALRSFTLPGGVSLDRIDFSVDARLAAASLGLAVLSAISFGLWPALRQSSRDVGERLRCAGRGVIGTVRGSSAMIATQVALSLVLVVGALLFVRSLSAALKAPLGFEPDGVAALSFAFRGHGYSNAEVPAAIDAILAEAEASPTIRMAALASHVPVSELRMQLRPTPEGREDEESLVVAVNTVTPKYFEVLGIPIVEGRAFDVADTDEAAPVALLNRAGAELLFPGRKALGQRLTLVRGLEFLEIVGIVEDHVVHSVADPPSAYLYLPAAQQAGVGLSTGANLVARGDGTGAQSLVALRQAMKAFDPSLPTYDARPIDAQMKTVLMPQRFAALLLGLLGAVSLFVAGVGIYATVAFGVRRRTREIGIRLALGASSRRLAAALLARVGRAVAIGIVGGVSLALALGRFVEGYLYGIDAFDARSFQVAAATLALAGLLAVVRPLLRALRIDPVRAISDA